MKVAWSGANALAQAMRYSAQQAAGAFIEPFREEPGSREATTETAV